MSARLSPSMETAIRNAHADGTISGATTATERALIRRGLAVGIYGTVTRPNPYSRTRQTVYNAYLGARLVETNG